MIRIRSGETNKSWVSSTDEAGNFEFPALPAGRYHLEATQMGFTSSSLDIELPVVPPGPIPLVLQVVTLAINGTSGQFDALEVQLSTGEQCFADQ